MALNEIRRAGRITRVENDTRQQLRELQFMFYTNKKRMATALGAISLAFATFSAPANATDLLGESSGDPHVDQQLRNELRWSGLYVGGGIQGGATVHDLSAKDYEEGESAPEVGGTAFIDGIGSEGVGLSGTVGYDQRFPGTRWVLGIFGNYVYSKDYWETDFGASGGAGTLSGQWSKDNEWTVGGRLGALVGPRAMIYGLAGYTQAEWSGIATWNPTGGDSVSTPFGNTTFDGITGGIGIEVKKTDFMSFSLEALHTWYEQEVLFDDRNVDGLGTVLHSEPSEWKVKGELRFKLLTE